MCLNKLTGKKLNKRMAGGNERGSTCTWDMHVVQFLLNQFLHFMERVLLEMNKNETAINVNLLKANSRSIR